MAAPYAVSNLTTLAAAKFQKMVNQVASVAEMPFANLASLNPTNQKKIVMPITSELVSLITERVGRFNVDVLSGWEAGLLGKERPFGHKLFDREPPAHLTGSRSNDWYAGRNAAIQHKKLVRRETRFIGFDGKDGVVVVRKGWIARTKVISQMERAGAYGVVTVSYIENGIVKRTVECGI